MSEKQIERLLSLLERERAAIVAGDYDAVTEFGPAKEASLSRLEEEEDDPARLSLVFAALTQNQRLLAAAIKGISTAQDRIAALNKVRDGLNVYDSRGRMANVANKKSAIVRKA